MAPCSSTSAIQMLLAWTFGFHCAWLPLKSMPTYPGTDPDGCCGAVGTSIGVQDRSGAGTASLVARAASFTENTFRRSTARWWPHVDPDTDARINPRWRCRILANERRMLVVRDDKNPRRVRRISGRIGDLDAGAAAIAHVAQRGLKSSDHDLGAVAVGDHEFANGHGSPFLLTRERTRSALRTTQLTCPARSVNYTSRKA